MAGSSTKPVAQRTPRPQHGGVLIEVLVAAVVAAFGLLGYVALQGRAINAEFEALQRSQALILVEDMAARLNINRGAADDYLGAGLVGAGALQDCTGTTGAGRDLCEWSNLLRGATERRGGAQVGAMVGARGCITRAPGTTHLFLVSVVWQGAVPTAGSANSCGQGDASFGDESLRRAVSVPVCMARLRDGPVGVPVPQRC
jgi:type IV pilus assembly protein PilV